MKVTGYADDRLRPVTELGHDRPAWRGTAGPGVVGADLRVKQFCWSYPLSALRST
ncbi:hypothetical protein GCM10010412_067490 [Nonomuraea recticatena]|uniref:Uncharacterized protein n=1 Tax=Nonomuraea recticatena TaxID=46178 RepID=A0ABN3ST34_9ACTN